MEPIERIVSYIPFLNKYPPCREAQVLPLGSELFEDDRIKVIETPGHSEGSISIVVDDEIAIVGDVMRKKAIFSVFGMGKSTGTGGSIVEETVTGEL